MRKQLLLLTFVLFWVFTANAQEGERLKVITGVRVNPFVMYDFDGNNGNNAYPCRVGRHVQ